MMHVWLLLLLPCELCACMQSSQSITFTNFVLWDECYMLAKTAPESTAAIYLYILLQLKALGMLQALQESADWALLSSFCDNSKLHKSIFKWLLPTQEISKESIKKFFIGNQFHITLWIINRNICKHCWKNGWNVERLKQE